MVRSKINPMQKALMSEPKLKSTSFLAQINKLIRTKNDSIRYNNPMANNAEKRLLKNFFIEIWEINENNNSHCRECRKRDRTCGNVFYKTNFVMVVGMDKIAQFFNGGVHPFNA